MKKSSGLSWGDGHAFHKAEIEQVCCGLGCLCDSVRFLDKTAERLSGDGSDGHHLTTAGEGK